MKAWSIKERLTRRLLLAAGVLLLLQGCANTFRSDVVTFHESPLPSGETIRVEAMDPEKQGSLEFRRYASLINQELADIGYRPVERDEEAELIAEVDYSVETGPTEVRSSRAGNRMFSRYHFYYGRYYDPFYFGLYDTWEPRVYSNPTFVRMLEMNIRENDPDGERIFEGRVRSTGRQDNLPEIMPYLITAMFTNFPGESGVTKVVTIETDQ